MVLLASPSYGAASKDFINTNSDRISYGTTAMLGNQSDITACAWIYPETKNTTSRTIVGKRTAYATNNEFVFNLGPTDTGADRIQIQKDASVALLLEAATMNVWQYACVSGTSASAKSYINGVNGATTAGDFRTGNGATGDIAVGGLITEASEYFEGRMAYIQVWNRLITTTEMINSMYCPGSVPSGLVFYSTLLDDVSGSQPDYSGNGHTGTATGPDDLTDGPPVSFCGGSH